MGDANVPPRDPFVRHRCRCTIYPVRHGMASQVFVLAVLVSLPAVVHARAVTLPSRSSQLDCAKDSIRPALSTGPWQWENPRPQGNYLNAVFALAPDDVWAGGFATLMHWDGRDWHITYPVSMVESPFSVRLIWASDADHVWAVVDNRLLRWNGDVWVESGLNPRNVGAYRGTVWGTGPDDVWTVSEWEVHHWDGSVWQEVTPASWHYGGAALWGTAPNDVTVVDGAQTHFRWNGSSWQPREPTPAPYLGGNGPGEPWFKRILDDHLLRFHGGDWETYLAPTPYVRAVWSDRSYEAWALAGGIPDDSLLNFDGKDWSIAHSVPHRLHGISGSAPDQVWAVGEKGALVRFDGCFADRRAGSVVDLNKVFGLSDTDVWAAGKSGTVLRRAPTEWETIQLPTQRTFSAIGGTSTDDLWVVGDAGTSFHFDGKSWTNVPSGTSYDLTSIWASGPADVWAGSWEPAHAVSTFLHWDGEAWSNWGERPPGTVLGLFGFAPDDVWAVGSLCDYFYPFNPRCVKTASHFDGSTWTAYYLGPPVYDAFERLVAIWGNEPRDVWALAENSAVYHWDGERWSAIDFPRIFVCTGLWGRAWNDILATCGHSVVHWDGVRWSIAPTPSGQFLSGVWSAGSPYWIVGGGGTVLRYDVPK
jgi:hypothetical protein